MNEETEEIFYVCMPAGFSLEEAEHMKDILYRRFGLLDAVIRKRSQIQPTQEEDERGNKEFKEVHQK